METQSLDQKTIEEIARRLVKAYDPREIYLLEPDRADTVDVGILVIIDDDKAGLQQRYALMAEGHKALIGVKIGKNILIYTKDEFEEYSQDSSTLSHSIKKYGKQMYARA